MESRTSTEFRIYKLILNNMHANCEQGVIVAISPSYEKLVEWYNSQLAKEMWRDERWSKSFIQGSPLEWYNPCYSLELNDTDHWGHGISDEWVRESVYYDILARNDFVVIEE